MCVIIGLSSSHLILVSSLCIIGHQRRLPLYFSIGLSSQFIFLRSIVYVFLVRRRCRLSLHSALYSTFIVLLLSMFVIGLLHSAFLIGLLHSAFLIGLLHSAFLIGLLHSALRCFTTRTQPKNKRLSWITNPTSPNFWVNLFQPQPYTLLTTTVSHSINNS